MRNIRLPFAHGTYCNAAVLLFGKDPQRFFVEAQLKCGRFKGTDSVDFQDEQTYEGPILHQLNEAMGFIGRNTRRAYRISGSPEREVIPEYPADALREALINALCHRHYAAVGTIQVRIYDDRIEVWNPGHLPPDLTVRKLYHRHASYPGNPLIAHALYRARLIEHWGTGTVRIIGACKEAGIKVSFKATMGSFIVALTRQTAQEGGGEPMAPGWDQVGTKSGLSRDQVIILRHCRSEAPLVVLLSAIGRKHRTKFRNQFIAPLVAAGLIEYTIPDKPNSRLQKYRLTAKGREYLK